MKQKALTSHDILGMLWKEMYEYNMVPDVDCFEAGQSEIMMLGLVERNNVISCIGKSAWRSVLDAYKCKNPERNCIHILGVGYFLTEYFIKPLNLPDDEQKAVASLGSLIYLIASFFDMYLDSGTSRHFILPRWILIKMILREERLVLSLLRAVGPGKLRICIKLLSLYFSKLDQLPFSTRHARLYKLIHRIILRVYEAECKTQNSNKYTPNILSIKRKSALQVVVMGLPGWLAKPEINREDFCWHLRWLYRYGEFFGWIDDIVDMEEDLAAGHPNLYIIKKERSRDKVDFDKYLTEKLVQRGNQILSEWNSRCENIEDIPKVLRDIFIICLVSSLGGFPAPTES